MLYVYKVNKKFVKVGTNRTTLVFNLNKATCFLTKSNALTLKEPIIIKYPKATLEECVLVLANSIGEILYQTRTRDAFFGKSIWLYNYNKPKRKHEYIEIEIGCGYGFSEGQSVSSNDIVIKGNKAYHKKAIAKGILRNEFPDGLEMAVLNNM